MSLCRRHVLATGQIKSQRASIGARTQPCLTPLWISNGSEAAVELHRSLRVSVERFNNALQFGRATDLWETLKRPSLLTRSNVLVI